MPIPGPQNPLGREPDSTSCLCGKRPPMPPDPGTYGNSNSRSGLKDAPGVSRQVGLFNKQVRRGREGEHSLWLNSDTRDPIHYHCRHLSKLGYSTFNKLCDGNENAEKDRSFHRQRRQPGRGNVSPLKHEAGPRPRGGEIKNTCRSPSDAQLRGPSPPYRPRKATMTVGCTETATGCEGTSTVNRAVVSRLGPAYVYSRTALPAFHRTPQALAGRFIAPAIS